MSLEARIELLTSAIIKLTAAIGGMQAPAPGSAETLLMSDVHAEASSALQKSIANVAARKAEAPNVQTDTTSGQQSAPTGESSSPAMDYTVLDYDKDVKTITLALSKAKGPETTKAILAKFDVASAKQLVAGQWADYIAACNEALA